MLHGILVDGFIIHVETVCSLINHIQIILWAVAKK